MKIVYTIFFICLGYFTNAQSTFIYTTSSSNVEYNYATIDIPSLNGRPDLVISVVPSAVALTTNPHPVGLWYNGSKWMLFNQDRQPMPAGASYTLALSTTAIIATANAASLNNGKVIVDAPFTNGNSNARFTITQNWNPNGSNGVYNPSDVEAQYDNGLGKWVISNKNRQAIPMGAAFNIVAEAEAGAVASTPSPITTGATSGQSDPAIYQFMAANRISYPATAKQTQLKSTEQVGGFTEKSFSQISFITENTVFNPPADVMYAGAMIQSQPYYESNRLNPVNKTIAPGTITISGGNGSGAGSYSRQLSSNTLSAYKDAVSEILQGINLSSSSGSMQYNFKACRSVQQGMVNVGINFRVTNFTGEAGLENKTSTSKSYVVGLVKQVYYSVSYRPTADNQNLFLAPTTLGQLQSERLLTNKNQPVYISQVDYGRMFLLVAESEASADSLKMFLEANYRGATVQAGGRLDYSSFSARNSVNVSIYSVGSNNNSSEADDISESSFRAFLRSGGTASLSNPGAPIAFRVRDFINGSDIATRLTADYTEVSGNATPQQYFYFVKPGMYEGITRITTDRKTYTPRKDDLVSISATGSAVHGAWASWDAKGPDGQANEATDANDPMPCAANQRQRTSSCECNRYAIICNIPDPTTSKKLFTCVGSGFTDKLILRDNSEPIYFTFNDYNTKDGGGDGFNITVTVIPREQVVKLKVKEPISN